MRCPHCSNKLLQKSGTHTRLRIRGPVEFDDSGIAHAKCFWCKDPVTVPIDLQKADVEEVQFTIPEQPPKTDP